jgi:ribokinase
MAPRITVIGSLNVDLTVWVDRLPAPDETLHGHGLARFRGGKGANQAKAAARLGADVAMVGCVGADGEGALVVEGLDLFGVAHDHVAVADAPTGIALCVVQGEGARTQVSIVVVAGANASVSEAHVEAAAARIAASDLVLLQGEIPAPAARRAAELARAAGVGVVVNPAPMNDVADAVVPLATVLVVNEGEAAELARRGVQPAPDALVVTTLGSRGAQIGGPDGVHIPAFAVTSVDPTGAGDVFCGALAVALAEGAAPTAAVHFACAAGAVSVTVPGAEPSIPDRAAVDAVLAVDDPS